MACDSPLNIDWNDNLYECLMDEYIQLKSTHKIIMLGDFNGRIGNQDDGIKDGDPVKNDNGIRLLSFARKCNLMILNREKICHGKWTRQEGTKKSIIDYFLIDCSCASIAVDMNIYDNGQNETGSDHNWMDMTLNIKGTTKRKSSDNNRKVQGAAEIPDQFKINTI